MEFPPKKTKNWQCSSSAVLRCLAFSMREVEHSPENLLRRLDDRDIEMSVLLQRVGILLETRPKDVTCLDSHGTRGTGRDAGIESDDGCDRAKGELHVQRANKAGSLEALKACLAGICRSQQQVGDVLSVHNLTSDLHFLHPLVEGGATS